MLAHIAAAIALAFAANGAARPAVQTVCAPLQGAMLYTVVNLSPAPIAVSLSDDSGFNDEDEPVAVGGAITFDAGDALPDAETYAVRIARPAGLLGAFTVSVAPGTACVTYVGA